jgi:cullin-associated NEDD8-dissociated protein 1
MDLHMTALALELCCTIMVDRKSIQNVGLAVRNKVLPQALILIRSALLQGQALQVITPPPPPNTVTVAGSSSRLEIYM